MKKFLVVTALAGALALPSLPAHAFNIGSLLPLIHTAIRLSMSTPHYRTHRHVGGRTHKRVAAHTRTHGGGGKRVATRSMAPKPKPAATSGGSLLQEAATRS